MRWLYFWLRKIYVGISFEVIAMAGDISKRLFGLVLGYFEEEWLIFGKQEKSVRKILKYFARIVRFGLIWLIFIVFFVKMTNFKNR